MNTSATLIRVTQNNRHDIQITQKTGSLGAELLARDSLVTAFCGM